MSYRIQLLSQFGLPTDVMEKEIRRLCPDFDPRHFADQQIFCSNDRCSCMAVSKRSSICKYFSELATQCACVWIVTNDTDDWHLKIQNGTSLLADLHLPLVNVDSDESCEPDGKDVRESISCDLPDQLTAQVVELDTAGAWSTYFKYSKKMIEECLKTCEIEFEPSNLSQLLSEQCLETVNRTTGAQLGFFVNEVLKIGLDLSPADDY